MATNFGIVDYQTDRSLSVQMSGKLTNHATLIQIDAKFANSYRHWPINGPRTVNNNGYKIHTHKQ